MEPMPPAWQVDSLPLSHQGSPKLLFDMYISEILCILSSLEVSWVFCTHLCLDWWLLFRAERY